MQKISFVLNFHCYARCPTGVACKSLNTEEKKKKCPKICFRTNMFSRKEIVSRRPKHGSAMAGYFSMWQFLGLEPMWLSELLHRDLHFGFQHIQKACISEISEIKIKKKITELLLRKIVINNFPNIYIVLVNPLSQLPWRKRMDRIH